MSARPFQLQQSVLANDGYVLGVVPSPCKRYIAVPFGSGTIQILDSQTLQPVGKGFPRPSGANGPDAAAISDLHFVKNGRDPFLVWVSAMDGNIALLDLRSGTVGISLNGKLTSFRLFVLLDVSQREDLSTCQSYDRPRRLIGLDLRRLK
jgi:WD40 repeat protein